jgi:hypothetical protein
MHLVTLLVPVTLACLLVGPSTGLAGHALPTRATQAAPRALVHEPVTRLPAAGKRWALVIGVDAYQDEQITTLRGAANDATTLGAALVERAGFPSDQVVVLASTQPAARQPTRVNILQRLSNLAAVVPKDGLLLVSFSGHGLERDGQAFLLPSDARASDDLALLEETAISVTRMHARIRATGVGQVIVLLDACRNDPVGGRADAANPLTAAYVRAFDFDVANREVAAFATLYATGVGDRAYEYVEKKQGYFTWAVVEGLRGAAADADGKVTLAALVKYVQSAVPKRIGVDLGAGKHQRPFATIEGYRADDLVLAVGPKGPRDTTSGDSRDAGGTEIEVSYWESIKDSTNSEDFEAYLARYPAGNFADLARIRLRALARPPAPRVVELGDLASNESAGKNFPEAGVRLTSGSMRVEAVAGTNLVADGADKAMFFFGPGFSGPSGYHVAEITIVEGTATSVTIGRPGVRNGASTPAWLVQAFDASGAPVGSGVGEGDVRGGAYLFPPSPQDFTITGQGIKVLRIASNNHLSTFAAIPVTRVSITLAPR